ncbi:MAG: glycosyltransferase family 2 protein [Erythrobacter sp.]|nr:glycosyltransferase family 2 protein [Erythrobacter sp.]
MAERQQPAPDVSILVVAYNSERIIADCLEAIAPACTRYTYEVLLVDNGDGGTAALVAERFPEVRIIPGKGNIGFAAGNNLLAKSATAPMLLLANPDLQMRPGAVDALLDGAKHYETAAAWGGVTLDREGRPDIGNSVHVPSLREMASRLIGRSSARITEGNAFECDERVEALSGGFVMFSRAAWDEAQGLDERYFLYCEEVDLFFRLSLMGYDFLRIGSARAFHDIGHGEITSPMRELYLNAGIMQFAILHWNPFRQFLAFTIIWLLSLQRYGVALLRRRFLGNKKKGRARYQYVATRPTYWYHGYHPTKGLLAMLAKAPL